MNRNNIWIHIALAVILITVAAVAGQFNRWFTDIDRANSGYRSKQAEKAANKPLVVSRQTGDREPEVLVRFKPGVTLDQIKKLAGKNNDSVEDEIESVNGLVSIDDLDNAEAAAVSAQYSSMSDLVEYAHPNEQISLDPTKTEGDFVTVSDKKADSPNDPLFADQWALNNVGQNSGKEKADIRALEAWAKSKGSSEIVVAVLDTGVDYTHTDLASNMWIRPDSVPAYKDDELGGANDLHGFNADKNQADPMDDNGHGTHCAGIIGAEGNNSEGIAGVNWKVKIMPLKFLTRSGYGSTKNAIEAINYAIDRKRKGVNLKVISASWGSYSKSKALEDVIRAAGEEGILFVAAAGNDSSDNDRRPHFPSSYKLPNVISVAALDRNDALTSFSSYGAESVHLAAPGKDIVSTWIGGAYREASGTSMATPYVSGVAALIVAAEPKISLEKLRDRLLSTSDKLDSLNGKVSSSGRVNAAKALGK